MGAQCAVARVQASHVVAVNHGACDTYCALIWARAEACVTCGLVCVRTQHDAEGMCGDVTGGDAGGGV